MSSSSLAMCGGRPAQDPASCPRLSACNATLLATSDFQLVELGEGYGIGAIVMGFESEHFMLNLWTKFKR